MRIKRETSREGQHKMDEDARKRERERIIARVGKGN